MSGFASVISKEALWNPLALTVPGALPSKFTDVKCYETSIVLLRKIVYCALHRGLRRL